VFSNRGGFEVASAGTDPAADTPVSPELIEWADVIFVMEPAPEQLAAREWQNDPAQPGSQQ
jgi:predicted protein tyrosine phosphatase